jgi:hypothetical protein
MLAALKDPVSHVMPAHRQSPDATESSAGKRPLDPSLKRLEDGTLVVGIHHYKDLDYGILQGGGADALKAEISNARARVFDLRATAPLPDEEKGGVETLFYNFEVANLLSSSTITPPGRRRHMHFGFVPQRGSTSGGMNPDFILRWAHR